MRAETAPDPDLLRTVLTVLIETAAAAYVVSKDDVQSCQASLAIADQQRQRAAVNSYGPAQAWRYFQDLEMRRLERALADIPLDWLAPDDDKAKLRGQR